MPKISQFFRLNRAQTQLDFVDVNTDDDLPLFLDPYGFTQSNDAWSIQCNEEILSFFEAVLAAIRAGDNVRGRSLLNNLGEPNETCLGLSLGRPAGRGVGRQQADQLFDKIATSRAAQSGLLSELADCELFIPFFGADKISDVTTNIIRRHLIDYTVAQCDLHRIPLHDNVASGMLWDSAASRWTNRYVTLPVIDGRKILLVPKASVRWNLAFSHSDYYNQFVLEFLQAEHLRQDTALVETLRNGRRRVTKKSLKELHPLAKDFLAAFTDQNPEVLTRYKRLLKSPDGVRDEDLDQEFNEAAFAQSLIDQLPLIDAGNASATRFHHLMIGALEFIFYPHLIYPVREDEINEGRKRIDISYTNNAHQGFFFRRRSEQRANALKIMVECKNYQKEMANPELDQLAGRFSDVRGRLGFLVGRSFDNRERFVARCRDTAQANNGFIIALVDQDIIRFLEFIRDKNRHQIDRDLERRFSELIN
ncbi:hypothetical protein UP09_28235 [Bradyrhizobium sp. LTSP885]|uniref:hypothetical protein n=1 Tax=Bradyrhizobium sp. LTSP885 TaxID=1619232 RepID=UPI0005C98CEC|nr:hypothetical protein [Bradyrhizobium sp. LTSP885]KJC37138.1 hypothetical protein UP09_28235 [Bradyrhizobium sp. LTSP885]